MSMTMKDKMGENHFPLIFSFGVLLFGFAHRVPFIETYVMQMRNKL